MELRSIVIPLLKELGQFLFLSPTTLPPSHIPFKARSHTEILYFAMLTIDNLVEILTLCFSCFGLGYSIGRGTGHKNNRQVCTLSGYLDN